MVASGFFSLPLPKHSEKNPSEARGVSFLDISSSRSWVLKKVAETRNEQRTLAFK